MSFVPLHVHSQYSILEASCSIDGLVGRACEYEFEAMALTDRGNLYGAVDFFKACRSRDIKPILGCEFHVAPTGRGERKKVGPYKRVSHSLILLAKNEVGYQNLCRLSSYGFTEGFYYFPRIDRELLEKYSEGLICLSGSANNVLCDFLMQKDEEGLRGEVEWYRKVFGEDYFFELQRHTMENPIFDESWMTQMYEQACGRQEQLNAKLVEMGKALGVGLVATNDTRYLDSGDWRAHEILLNVQSGEPVEIWEKDSHGNPTFRVPNPKRRVLPSREYSLKSSEEMAELFSDVPEALEMSGEIASRCCVEIDFVTKHYPVYVPPSLKGKEYSSKQRKEASEEYLRQLCEEGLPKRYHEHALSKVKEKYLEQDPMEVVHKRLERELSIITRMGMCDYLLIVWDFINWAKSHDIPVGPGRGSGAGSIILYLIGVTDIEPLRFNLFFERFINPERISYPDIDVDICMARRQEVIDYTVGTYGKDNVAQIITFGTMKAKMTIKDVGRVLSVPLSKVNRIAKLVPDELGITLEKALEMDVDLHNMYQDDEDAKRIIDLGLKLEGSVRNTGIHAAGIIVSADALTEHIPICLAKDSEMAATQYSMKPVEAVGMLKIDFLGLKTLTSIQIAVDEIAKNHGTKIDWVNLPLDNRKAFELLHQGKTLGVFQMESGGMQELAKQLQPDLFEEIIAIGALYRPGPMDMIPSFVARKHKREPIGYDHPLMEKILSETYGIMVYQEQVMQIASQLGGYSLGEGDVLRRAMGKKDAKQMAKEREKFREGAVANGIDDEVATAIFDKMEKFAAYGFNKSHAAAYGFLTYVTAYLKANYPKEWMAALMTCDRDDVSKVAKFIRACLEMHIKILPPDVNEAKGIFVATEAGIRFAMSGIKGVGEGVVEAIIAERDKGGAFASFYDFFKRIDIKKVGKKAIEHLVDAGSFDFTGWSRDELRLSIEELYATTLKEQQDQQAGVLTFFSMMGEDSATRFATPPKVVESTPKLERLKKEKELLGFFLTGHPMDEYRQILGRLSCVPLCDLEGFDHNQVVRIAFIIESVQVRISAKNQRKFAILTISDGMESIELPIWSDLFEQKAPLLDENQLLYAVVQIDKREESMRLSARWIDDLSAVNETMIKECDAAFDRAKTQTKRFASKKKETTMTKASKPLVIKAQLEQLHLSDILKIKQIVKSNPGSQPVQIAFYRDKELVSTLHLDSTMNASADLLKSNGTFLDRVSGR